MDPYFTLYSKINDLNVQNETIKVLEGNMGEFFYNLGIKNAFLTMTKNLESIKKRLINSATLKKKQQSLLHVKVASSQREKIIGTHI